IKPRAHSFEWAFCVEAPDGAQLTHGSHRGGIAKHFPVFRPSGLQFGRHAGSVHHPSICDSLKERLCL
ncbi:hypothetical protein, partial [Alkalimonas mucilaginosa]